MSALQKESPEELSRRLRHLHGQLNEAVEGLTRSEDFQARWTRVLAHSLNNQLFTIFFLLEGLEEAKGSQRREICLQGLQTMSARIYQSVTRLADLACWSEADDWQVTDLARLLPSLLADVQGYARFKHIQLDWSAPPDPLLVRGDEVSISEIFAQLLINGVKYTPLGSPAQPVCIEVTAELTPDTVCITVGNPGPGLTPQDLEHLFQPGWTGRHGPSGGEPQAGHGLALVRQTLELLGGSIECRSRPGEWTEFEVELIRFS